LRKRITIALLSLGIFLTIFTQQDHTQYIPATKYEDLLFESTRKEVIEEVSAQVDTHEVTIDVVIIVDATEEPTVFSVLAPPAQTQNVSDNDNVIKIVTTFKAKASWYKHGTITANGEKFNPNRCTVAHKTLAFNTKVRLTNLVNGKSVITRVNDRGPYIRGRQLDVTLACAKLLGMEEVGVAELVLDILL
jgi:rare lipoprotein A (peptidoglycan hydrolase)